MSKTMAGNPFKIGDIVRVAPDDAWKQPVRGWAERERLATVEAAYSNGSVTIRFNNARNKAVSNVEYFNAADLILVERPESGETTDG